MIRSRRVCVRALLVAMACVAVGATAGCVESTAPEDALSVGLTTRAFGRDSLGNVHIGFRVSNAGNTTVYLARCGSEVTAGIERRDPGFQWAATTTVASCVSSLYLGPYRLDPGQTVQATQVARLPVGEFRLRLFVALDPNGAPTRSATSDVISIF